MSARVSSNYAKMDFNLKLKQWHEKQFDSGPANHFPSPSLPLEVGLKSS